DVPTAMKYYDQALIANPNDFITINNIGVNLMQQGQEQEAKKYFLEALKINEHYANTYHALGMIAESENDLPAAFDSTIQAIKFNKNKDVLYQNSVKLAFDIAGRLTNSNTGKFILEEYKDKLSTEGGTEIEIIEDPEIQTAAKFEFAENYNRQKHIIRFKPKYTATEHLIIHELVHLDFVIEARKKDLNQIFFSEKSHKSLFQNELESAVNKLRKMDIPEESITNYCNGLFSMINSQIFNTPVDLFIENFLYHQYPKLRPYQFLSLINMTEESMKAVTDKTVVDIVPKNIISKSKIYNLINAIQLKELFGLDFISDFKATPAELTQAQKFYGEFAQYKDDREPAEEYELVMNWAEDLKLNKFFELEGELQYRKRSDMDTFFKSLEEDPLGIEDPDPVKEREMQKFLKNHQEIGINMAVAMYMVEALRYFDEMPKQKIRKIAAEIALQGTQGYNPDKKDYSITSIQGKLFSGFHILAWYYVSFAIALPELLSQLQLPYDAEYKYALTLYNPD
ncbi:MAG: tetratricopeptide repeat protein, partial [Mariniphaga sp.]|nr:tetratricopeptide repeat protein [Mariniphaga sp.]